MRQVTRRRLAALEKAHNSLVIRTRDRARQRAVGKAG